MLNRWLIFAVLIVIVGEVIVKGCLITNCPRGGKRAGKIGRLQGNIKPCTACGPGRTGQCFGPTICCGPFGCLMGTSDTVICQREGLFQENEPCIAGNASCRRSTGRCALDGICCNQDSCHTDSTCSFEEKTRSGLTDNAFPLDLYNLINYPAELSNEK